ncbi:MAG: hypothetical protein ACM32E_24730 [Gemmatimonadota bacterium]
MAASHGRFYAGLHVALWISIAALAASAVLTRLPAVVPGLASRSRPVSRRR